MRLRDLKLLVLAVSGLFLGAAPVQATTVPMTPGNAYALESGNTYSSTVLFESIAGPNTFLPGSFTHNYTMQLGASDLPLYALTTSIAFPLGASVKSLTIEWLKPSLVSLGSLVVTNADGSLTGNPPLVIGLSLLADLGDYIVRVTGLSASSDIYNLRITTTPLPPALILFGTALAGLTWLGRRRRSAAAGH
jgi:hypothetical protein